MLIPVVCPVVQVHAFWPVSREGHPEPFSRAWQTVESLYSRPICGQLAVAFES